MEEKEIIELNTIEELKYVIDNNMNVAYDMYIIETYEDFVGTVVSDVFMKNHLKDLDNIEQCILETYVLYDTYVPIKEEDLEHIKKSLKNKLLGIVREKSYKFVDEENTLNSFINLKPKEIVYWIDETKSKYYDCTKLVKEHLRKIQETFNL